MTFKEYKQKCEDEIKKCVEEMRENGYTEEEINDWVNTQQSIPTSRDFR